MIKSVSRKALFAENSFVDAFIAFMQQAYAADFDISDKSHVKVLNRYYDHQVPFQHTMKGTDAVGVFAVAAENRTDYRKQMPEKFAFFLQTLSAGNICLLDFLNTALFEFRFSGFVQKNAFRRKFRKGVSSNAFVMSCDEVLNVLPLFLFGNYYGGRPELFFIASDYPIAISLCSDGNFHYHTYSDKQEEVQMAAVKAGFLTGGIELCAYQSICSL